MVANRYTLLDQSAVPELVDACEVHGVRIVAAAVFNSGLLASTPSRDAKYDYEAVPDEVFARALEIDKVCADHGVALPAAALQYPLLDPRVISVVAGAATPDQLRQNLTHLNTPIPPALWQALTTHNLIRTSHRPSSG